jgi:hypothetical protein
VRQRAPRAERHALGDHAPEAPEHAPPARSRHRVGSHRLANRRRSAARGVGIPRARPEKPRLRSAQRGGFVRLHVPPVRRAGGLVAHLLPRVVRGGRRGAARAAAAAHAPPRGLGVVTGGGRVARGREPRRGGRGTEVAGREPPARGEERAAKHRGEKALACTDTEGRARVARAARSVRASSTTYVRRRANAPGLLRSAFERRGADIWSLSMSR